MVWVYHQGSRLVIDSGGTPPCLSLWERCPVRTLGGEGLFHWAQYITLLPSQSASPPALPGGEPSGGHSFRKVSSFLIHLVRPPPCIEPGDLLRCGSTIRVTDPPLTAAARRPSQTKIKDFRQLSQGESQVGCIRFGRFRRSSSISSVHYHVSNRVTPSGGSPPPGYQSRNCQRPLAARTVGSVI